MCINHRFDNQAGLTFDFDVFIYLSMNSANWSLLISRDYSLSMSSLTISVLIAS